YITNGMISGPSRRDLQSFFWRQVVSESPLDTNPSGSYEEGWNAINEFIRSDGTWDGYQRNVFLANNGDGSFIHCSGAVGLDFPDDSRAFALTDLDHDGGLELVLKNRSGPQLRILRNVMEPRGNSICFRLRGGKSNRDAVGASVTLETQQRQQTRFLQAGSGFLSQHSKELFFGLGEVHGTIDATVRWPNGVVQKFEALPVNCRVELEEGSITFRAEPFAPRVPVTRSTLAGPEGEPPPFIFETWLIDPLPAPDFTLPDLRGRTYTLS